MVHVGTCILGRMLERDLQNYLFFNPDVLFPNQIVRQKRREVFIDGRRIDLLFEVDGTQYIVELKRDTIRREDIGQIFEYYGLMRRSKPQSSFRMILVAPSIPEYRRIPLEEMGIRCVEVQLTPKLEEDGRRLRDESIKLQKRERTSRVLDISSLMSEKLEFDDLLPPVSSQSMCISQKLLLESLPSIQKQYSEYEIRPIKMVKPNQPDVLCIPTNDLKLPYQLVGAGAWWAYSFGHSDEMAKNDIPNISVNALPWGLDFAINAELQTSQRVMRERITSAPKHFDRLIDEHGDLQLQAWLKLEVRPRMYYWVLLKQFPAETWGSEDLIKLHQNSESDYDHLRSHWIEWIINQNKNLPPAQKIHLEGRSRNLNLAFRLVYSFEKDHVVWNLPFREQIRQFDCQYGKLKSLITFFQ